SYPVTRGTAWTAAAGAAAPGRAALGRAALGAPPGAPGAPGCPGGVTGAAAHPLSLVSFGLPGPASSPPAPRPWDPVWQFECTSPLASGSGDGVADATETQPTGTANAAAATRLTIAFSHVHPLSTCLSLAFERRWFRPCYTIWTSRPLSPLGSKTRILVLVHLLQSRRRRTGFRWRRYTWHPGQQDERSGNRTPLGAVGKE